MRIGVMFRKCKSFSERRSERRREFVGDETEQAHTLFAHIAQSKGHDLVHSALGPYDHGQFDRAFVCRGDKWVYTEAAGIDVIYDWCRTDEETLKKKGKIQIPIYNHLELNRLCWDKNSYSAIFGDRTPKTFTVANIKDLKRILPQIPGDHYVLKPRFGFQGQNILILPKNQLPERLTEEKVPSRHPRLRCEIMRSRPAQARGLIKWQFPHVLRPVTRAEGVINVSGMA